MTYDPHKTETVTFAAGDDGVTLCKLGGKIAFVHHNYTGVLPKSGETWRVFIAGETPSKKNPKNMVYFVMPIGRVAWDGVPQPVQQFDEVIREVAANQEQYDECLAALRAGLIEPTTDALSAWIHERTVIKAKRHNNAAQRARQARILLKQYGFKLLRETVLPSGEWCFTTHEFYEAYWAPMREGEWLIVMTSLTRGYALSLEYAGWYYLPGAVSALPPVLEQNWNPEQVFKLLAFMQR